MNRRDFAKTLAAVMVAATVPLELPSQEYTGKTYILKTTWKPELAQDLTALHGIDAEEELRALIRESVKSELGDKKGTLTAHLIYDPYHFEPRRYLKFIHDGKNDKSNFWGLTI